MAHAPPPTATPPEPSRAFARSCGVLFQVVGVALALGSCCWWSFSGLTQTQIDAKQPIRDSADWMAQAGGERLWAMGGVVVSFAGGLGLAALGLGLQAERVVSGRAATWTAAIATLFWLVRLLRMIFVTPPFSALAVSGVMLLVWGGALVLAWISADELCHNPPPADAGLAPADLKVDRLIDRERPADLRDL